MYKLEKNYVVLAKDGKKIANAGLQKISITDQKVRIEYFLNTLPVHYGGEMECVLKYRQQGEVISTRSWKEKLVKINSRYVFIVETSKPVEEIMESCLILQGNQMIVADEKMSEVSQRMKEDIAVSEEGTVTQQSEMRKEPEAANEMKTDSPKIEYIRDLEFLKSGNEEFQQLYYNSFLLHGFYQYRYFILGKDFIGVPDHFYEREAIAAKMMGFPYFMEADFVEACRLDGEMRNELPKTGSFGYYLKKLSRD